MTAHVGLWIDWDEDLTWGNAHANCSDLLISATYTRGSAPEITGAAQAGSATFVLQNPAGLFDPDYASGALYGKLHDGVPVWFGANEDGTITTPGTVRGRFAGRIVEVAPLPVAGAGASTPTAEIVCEDALGWYGRTPVELSDDCSPAVPTPIQGAFDKSDNTSSPAVPILPHNTTPGKKLLLVLTMAQGVGSGTSTPDFRDHGGTVDATWTQQTFTTAYDSTQSGGPGARVHFGIYTRPVRGGEANTSPVQVYVTGEANQPNVWLWELPSTVTFGTAAGYTTGSTPGSGIPTGGTATLPSTSGFTVGGMACQATSYEYIVDIAGTSGTGTQDPTENVGGDNRGYAATRTYQTPGNLNNYVVPPTWIATSTGTAMSATLTYDPGGTGSHLSPFGVAGGVLPISGITSLPTIPYPGNQVG
jgi:hypothetical protein